MNPKVLDIGQKLISGGLITISASALAALGYGVYRIKVEKPKYLKSLQENQDNIPPALIETSSSSTTTMK